MADFKETVMGYVVGEKQASFCSAEKKWINKIIKLKETHPDEVHIDYYPEDNCGILLAHIPTRWIKVSPPRQVSEEQKAAAAERFRAMHRAKEADDD